MKLFDCGVLCNLRISRWSGKRRLTNEDYKMVGLDPKALPQSLTDLGKKSLVPPHELKEIMQIENKARSFLFRNSKPFTLSSCQFVPKKLFPTVEQTLADLESDFAKAVDRFILKFEEIKKEMQESYPDFWTKCLKQHYPSDPKSIRDKFDFRFTFFKIDSLDEASKEALEKEVQDFVSSYVGAMRKQTIDFCELMTARLTGKPFGDEDAAKEITGKTLSSFRKYVQTFSNMNIFEDAEIQNMLGQFKKDYLGELVTADNFGNTQVRDAALASLSAIIQKASMEDGSTSQFINSLKRKITL